MTLRVEELGIPSQKRFNHWNELAPKVIHGLRRDPIIPE